MAAEAGGDARAGIGTRLKAAREKKGLTILQAAEKLHVDPRILESLEAEDFAALGAPVYVKGHMRHYAELVDERPAELQELYATSTRAPPVQPDLTRIPMAHHAPDPGKFAGPAVVAIVALTAIGALWWLFTGPSEKPQPTQVQQSAQSSAAGKSPEAESVDVGSETPAPGAQRSQPVASGKVAKSAPSVPATTAPAPSARMVAGAASTAVGTSAASAALRTVASAMTAVPPSTRAKEGELTLKFSADSWAEVYDASGQRLFYDVGAASSAHTVRGPAPMRVVLGNAAGVALEFNGRPASIPSAVKPDGSVHFIINAHGRAAPATEGN